MGDHRANIKIEFTMHGQTDRTEMNINWFDDGNGLDRRVCEWFEEKVGAAMSRYEAQVYASQREAREREAEQTDRAEYERLKAKFEPLNARDVDTTRDTSSDACAQGEPETSTPAADAAGDETKK